MRHFAILAFFALVVIPCGNALRPRPTNVATADSIRNCTREFLKTLDAAHRARANPSFDDEVRRTWQFVPHTPPGVTLGEMSDASRIAARRLLSQLLSTTGRRKVEEIMQNEALLRELESRPDRPADWRDPGRYGIAIFGDPASDGPFGIKLQGHHVSLNFTIIGDRCVAHAPGFLGANPGEVGNGLWAGRRALADEEDALRDLVSTLSAQSLRSARVAETAPPDVLFGPGREILFDKKNGLAAESMTAQEQEKLLALIEVYASNFKKATAAEEMQRLRAAGFESVRFFWAGDFAPGVGHYARIEGPTLLIEYDNTQNGANHIHTLWRDPERDFGGDPLREHYEKEHKKRK